jgi:hypothetical protein
MFEEIMSSLMREWLQSGMSGIMGDPNKTDDGRAAMKPTVSRSGGFGGSILKPKQGKGGGGNPGDRATSAQYFGQLGVDNPGINYLPFDPGSSGGALAAVPTELLDRAKLQHAILNKAQYDAEQLRGAQVRKAQYEANALAPKRVSSRGSLGLNNSYFDEQKSRMKELEQRKWAEEDRDRALRREMDLMKFKVSLASALAGQGGGSGFTSTVFNDAGAPKVVKLPYYNPMEMWSSILR